MEAIEDLIQRLSTVHNNITLWQGGGGGGVSQLVLLILFTFLWLVSLW